MKTWARGQRWVSDGEPELGLGIVTGSGDGRVDIEFPAAGEKRCYAIGTAPLRRVNFLTGDRVQLRSGAEVTIDGVHEKGALRIYDAGGESIPESELADSISFSKPEDRLFGGMLDDPADFDLRAEALQWRAAMRRSPLRGLEGARMDLIPHQLFIANEVSNRLQPRVLLADEVGLGKTIEACLILHRLLLTGRASRVLLLVPQALVHQWFVELLRRFQLSFAIFDEARCEAIESGEPEANPFLDSQLVLAAIDFLAADERRSQQILAAGWDVLVVDEAHHLEWSAEQAGPSYQMVAGLAAAIESVLLLTATPRQLGPDGHFARLRLLDPSRYDDIENYKKQTEHYVEVADAIEALTSTKSPPRALEQLIAGRHRMEKLAAAMEEGKSGARESLIAGLLDGFGVGRVMFRNTRRKLGGFPERQPVIVAVSDKLQWLHELLENLENEKVLVIGKTRELAEEISDFLTANTTVKAALFHEDLSLLQRDRNAAYFADEDGARVLLCSEIGSEGRNFQFARHLVLFDLPDDVDLLEQRIGRLDRIGQRGTIRIHAPYIAGTEEEVRVRWLDDGLDAFRASPPGAAEIQRELVWDLDEAMDDPSHLPALIVKTIELRQRIAERLARGEERLLERTSHRPEKSAELVNAIRALDQDNGFEEFLIRMFDFSGLHIEELGGRRYFLHPSGLKSDAFPALPNDGMTVTLDRKRALEREQEAFLTADHPMVRGALDFMLGSESGNASFGVWDSAGEKTILLEAIVVIECVAPAHLHVDRFLPQTPLRILVDHRGNDQTDAPAFSNPLLRKGEPAALARNPAVRGKILPAMLERVREIESVRKRGIIESAMTSMRGEMSAEIARLRDLAEVNDHIKPEEIVALEERENELADAINNARMRLDAVRLIWKAPIG